MAKKQSANLEKLFQEALCKQIGEQRYQSWFGVGVRFDFSSDALDVQVKSEFLYSMLRSAYTHILAQVAYDLLGRAVPVKIVYVGQSETDEAKSASDGNGAKNFDASSRELVARRPSAQSSFFPLANQVPFVDQVPPVSQGATNQVPLVGRNENASVESSSIPKRRRGRPPKSRTNADYSASSVESPLFDASFSNVPPRPFLSGYGSPADGFGTSASLATSYPTNLTDHSWEAFRSNASFGTNAQPPKRKRGRPRKNPLPENSAQFGAPTTLPPMNAASSFSDEFNRSLQRSVEEANLNAARPALDLNLSESERVAWAVGDFTDASSRNASEPIRRVPGKRGRPKGSVVRRSAPVNSFGDEDEILRDANGFTVVKRPKEPAKVRLENAASNVRFASLRTFVEGYSNQLARRVADVAIAEPGAMNPIFICGPTSVGKTHLLEGICEAYARLPGIKPPLYMTSEEFTSAFIQSLRGNGSFRDRFKNISALALDDVHFLEGKTSTQTELLNVVDFLRSRRVQMIFSANRPLSELSKLRGELTTRIESGVVCQIGAPERETLAQIFRQTALQRNLIVPEEVCRYVVSRFATHARQLSGVLNRLYATHLTSGAPIDLDLARVALADLTGVGYRNIKLEDVERVVQETFGLNDDSLKSSSRAKKYADPRAVAMWLARKHTRSALAEIGAFFGGRKHTAVIFAQKKVDEWIRENVRLESGESVGETIERIERALTYARS